MAIHLNGLFLFHQILPQEFFSLSLVCLRRLSLYTYEEIPKVNKDNYLPLRRNSL